MHICLACLFVCASGLHFTYKYSIFTKCSNFVVDLNYFEEDNWTMIVQHYSLLLFIFNEGFQRAPSVCYRGLATQAHHYASQYGTFSTCNVKMRHDQYVSNITTKNYEQVGWKLYGRKLTGMSWCKFKHNPGLVFLNCLFSTSQDIGVLFVCILQLVVYKLTRFSSA